MADMKKKKHSPKRRSQTVMDVNPVNYEVPTHNFTTLPLNL